MALFTDRRTQTVHDIGMNAPHDHDPTQGLAGWASAHSSARMGLAASILPAPVSSRNTVLPGQMNAPRMATPAPRPTDWRPSIVSPAEQRASVRPAAVPSRVGSWGGSGMTANQTVLPGQAMTPMAVSGRPTQTVLPTRQQRRPLAGGTGWAAKPLAVGASFAQKTRRAPRMT